VFFCFGVVLQYNCNAIERVINMTEIDIQNQIRLELSKHGIVFRTNAGEFYQGKLVYSKEFKQPVLINLTKIKGLPKGFTDLLYLSFDGKAAFIECKALKGKIRVEQENFINLMKKYNYKAGIARSVEDALKIINLENICPHGYRDWDQCPICCH
jgi:hypothetical protein